MRIVLVGASGFLGRYVLKALVADGHECEVLTRAAVRRAELDLIPGVEKVQADVYEPGALADRLATADAVVSMAGILNESAANSFHRVHVELVGGIIEACRRAGVQRLLHVSALRAGDGKSEYLKTKGEAETLLNSEPDLNVTIFRPSVIFGNGDEFFSRFATLLLLTRVLPLACPDARLQPVYAADVAGAMTASLDDPMTWGKCYELAGPETYTLKELVQWTAGQMGRKRRIIGLPGPISVTMAAVMGLVPGKPFSMDNYRSLQTDSTTSENGFAYFGIDPRAIDTVVPDYLTGSVHQHRLQSFRRHCRR